MASCYYVCGIIAAWLLFFGSIPGDSSGFRPLFQRTPPCGPAYDVKPSLVLSGLTPGDESGFRPPLPVCSTVRSVSAHGVKLSIVLFFIPGDGVVSPPLPVCSAVNSVSA
ncbi:hypothetical protein ATANTOWER_015935 [Ataeniobius toweri]|uniref:Secreted protein n=1 Tax=Ataeniobius toweri TaxID=208326 RepID=A0ABU7B9W6_9TELE|nr:hypothetical protein [Ataeniobius toweri]